MTTQRHERARHRAGEDEHLTLANARTPDQDDPIITDDATERVVIDLRDHGIRAPHHRSAYERYAKPAFDRAAGLLLAVATLPVQAAVAVAVRMSMGKPILFLQDRAGLNGDPFTIFKFRTMLDDRRRQDVPYAGTDRRRTHKTVDDPRVTKVGAFLRKWSLDELPQLWNIARGDMSLVGPRPELMSVIDAHYEPWQHRRHDVKPGMTGLWQVSARNDDDLMYECTEIDLEYVDSISLATDLRILAKTLPAALGSSKGF